MSRMGWCGLLDQLLGPNRIVAIQRWIRLLRVVEVVIPAQAVGLFDQRLQVEPGIPVGAAERNTNDRSTLWTVFPKFANLATRGEFRPT
jgi:hypothetical protein